MFFATVRLLVRLVMLHQNIDKYGFFLVLIFSRQREPENLVLTDFGSIKALPCRTFRQILETLSVLSVYIKGLVLTD